VSVDIASSQRVVIQSLKATIPSLKLLSDERIEQKIGKEKLLEVTEYSVGYVVASSSDDISHNELFALLCQVFRCLGLYITNSLHLPVTVKTLVDSIGLLEYAVDICFPGYGKAKLLRHIVRSRI
jgi:hypothetical protein